MKNAPKIPEALRLPVSLDLFLRYTAGGKYKDDRLKKYRMFLAENMQFHRFMLEGRLQGKRLAEMPKPPLVQVGEVVAKHRDEGFRNETEFWFSANSFMAWLAAQQATRARHAANTRWSHSGGKRPTRGKSKP
jgi:hypothetical protein